MNSGSDSCQDPYCIYIVRVLQGSGLNVSLFVLCLSTWLCLCLCWPCAPLVLPPCFHLPHMDLFSPCLVFIYLIVLTCFSCAFLTIYSSPCPLVFAGSWSFSPLLSLSLLLAVAVAVSLPAWFCALVLSSPLLFHVLVLLLVMLEFLSCHWFTLPGTWSA